MFAFCARVPLMPQRVTPAGVCMAWACAAWMHVGEPTALGNPGSMQDRSRCMNTSPHGLWCGHSTLRGIPCPAQRYRDRLALRWRMVLVSHDGEHLSNAPLDWLFSSLFSSPSSPILDTWDHLLHQLPAHRSFLQALLWRGPRLKQ